MLVPFNPGPGIIGDETDFENAGWSDGDNIRFWRGQPETVKGFESLTLDILPGVCRTVFSWVDQQSLQTMAFGLHNGLTVWQTGDEADITPASGFTTGEIDGTGGTGYGTGAYGAGDYGEPSTTDFFPMTWSFDSRQTGYLYANPRGQGIFRWENDLGTPAALLTNAPAECNYMLVTPNGQVMALGCTDTGSNFNPSCIRLSDPLDDEIWDPTNTAASAQQIYLEGNGRIVGARKVGPDVFVWTGSELFRLYLTDAWQSERVGKGCGLAGPNAAQVIGQTAYWPSGDLQFWGCGLGGTPNLLLSNDGKPCAVRGDFAAYAAASQNDKINASAVSERGEVVWSYADSRDGYECSRLIRFSTLDGAWSRSIMARTAMLDAGPQASPVGVTFEGNQYWQETGNSADGSPLQWSITSGGLYLDPGERHLMLREWRPDFRGQLGTVTLQVWSRDWPQGEETDWGTFMAPAGTEKVDLRVSGLIFRFKFSGDSLPSYARSGKQSFDVTTTGRR